jgi:hypothetical protein
MYYSEQHPLQFKNICEMHHTVLPFVKRGEATDIINKIS